MPTYVYKFVDTGETVEVQQSFTDDSLTEYAHPATGEVMPVKKVFQPVGVTFKGSGFFKTDNRASSTPSSTSSASGSSSGDSSGSSSSGSSDGGGSGDGSKGSGTSSTASSGSSAAGSSGSSGSSGSTGDSAA